MGLLNAMQKRQQEEAFRGELQGLGPNPSQDALAQVAARYAGPEGIMRHADRQTQIKATQEAAMARLTQAAQNFERTWQLQYKSAKTQEERLALEQQREQFKQGLQTEAARLAGARANYEFGFQPGAAPAPTVAPQAPTGPQGALPVNVLSSDAAAYAAAAAGGSGTVNRQMSLAEMAGMTMGGAPLPAEPPIPAPQSTPAPASAAAAPAAQAIPPMPPEIMSAPRKVQEAWLLQQTKAMASAPTGQGTDAVVKAIVEGRMQMPSGFALRSPYWQDIIAKVAQQDPNFDASRYGARAAARRTFASGPEARNVTALNTVIGHLGTLDEMAAALVNKDLRAFNAVTNRLAQEFGDPRIVNFDVARQAVAEETMRVFRQVNASEQEVMHWKAVLMSAGSPQQLRGSIATLGKLLDSRVDAIAQQYERTLSGSNPARVDPANRARLDQLIKQGGSNAPSSIQRQADEILNRR